MTAVFGAPSVPQTVLLCRLPGIQRTFTRALSCRSSSGSKVSCFDLVGRVGVLHIGFSRGAVIARIAQARAQRLSRAFCCPVSTCWAVCAVCGCVSIRVIRFIAKFSFRAFFAHIRASLFRVTEILVLPWRALDGTRLALLPVVSQPGNSCVFVVTLWTTFVHAVLELRVKRMETREWDIVRMNL